MDDVETYVQRNFASPIDAWALSDAKVLMERAQRKKAAFLFPIEKMFPMLQKVSEGRLAEGVVEGVVWVAVS